MRTYDSKSNTLILASQVHVETLEGATILARHGVVTQNPRRVVLEAARVERPASDIDADQLTLFLRDDNTVSRMAAAGEVRGVTAAKTRPASRLPRATSRWGRRTSSSRACSSGE